VYVLYSHAYVHASCTYECILTYIQIYINTYRHTEMQRFRHTDIQTYRPLRMHNLFIA
jgi:hypothetical protein